MAYGFYNLLDKLKRYYTFSKFEKRWLLLSIVILAFIVGFNDGREVFEWGPWLQNFILGLIAVIIAVFVHQSVQRIFGLEQGYRVEFKPFIYGLIGGLVIAFMSYGKLIVLAYSGLKLNIMEKHRLGYFRYQLGYFQLGKISAMGPIANLMVAILFSVMTFLPAAFIEKMVLVNVLFAITNMLPIPPMDGANVLYASRIIYVLLLAGIAAVGLMLIYSWVSTLYAVITGIAFGFLAFTLYIMKVESKGGWKK
ncbi:hypothetical protein JXB11_03600 [Candidatus Woesearchaeota archaeon]|nr:hypothetical protein [Candidatus Woesearchaeota archaeon]